jgi:kynurenine formamidase
MRYIDLTHMFDESMPVYPGDPPATLKQVASIDKEGFSDHLLSTGMHVGTHMDAPLHMIEGGKRISDIAPEKFFGRGYLVDARGASVIDRNLVDVNAVREGDVVLLFTGFSSKFGQLEYYETYPTITEEFAELMVQKKVRIVGMDTPSPDRPPFPVHKILLKHEILIIENLTNLEQLLAVKEFQVAAPPMKFHADAALVRAIAQVS